MKPILFNTEMVRALLEGRKTVTRRAIKFSKGCNPWWTGYVADGPVLYGSNNIPVAKCPYKPGNILYVRETWSLPSDAEVKAGADTGLFLYKADEVHEAAWAKWRPSIHMPEGAARIFLRVTDVRAERLQDISAEQIDAEGCKEWGYSSTTGELLPSGPAFFKLAWNDAIKSSARKLYGWDANPWVWVIEFERISREEAEGG